jgi:hypothetical protein
LTISTSSSSVLVAGDGVATSFQFPFVGDSADNIIVQYIDADGIQTTLNPTQYTLVINAAGPNQLWGIGGSITYPLVGSPIAIGTYLSIQRLLPLTQEITVRNQGNYYAQVTEQALDLLEMQIQQVSSRTGQIRGVWTADTQYNYGDVVQDGANGANTQNYYMCAIPNESDVWADDLAAGDWSLSINVQQIAAYATAAAASAAAALASQIAAAASASSASTSASTATTQAGIATTQASNAASSASAASTSASNASTSASAASTSATNASNSASSASTSASTATTQASNASTSATNASNSAAAAAASAVLAASNFNTTSTTSNTIGTGNKTFTVQANKNFVAGVPIIAVDSGNSANYMQGTVVSYSSTTLVIDSDYTGGSGTIASWNISVCGIKGTDGGGAGTVTSVSVTTANGISGSVATATTTPAITLTLGAITPTTVTASSTVQGTQLISTVATGTAPLSVSSTTVVPNLKAATANAINSSTTSVDTSAATAPSSGQVLTATSSTTATWQTPSGGSGWLSDPYTYRYYSDDFVGKQVASPSYDSTVAGTAASSAISLGNMSEIGTGTTTTGTATLMATINIPSGKLGGLEYNALASINAVSDGTNTFEYRVGVTLTNLTSDPSRGVYFRYTHSVNSGNWQCVSRSGGVETVINTAVAPTLYNYSTQAISTLKFVVNAGATSIEFFINNVSMGTITTNIPTSGVSYEGHGIVKSAGTSSRSATMLFQSVKITR